MFLALVPCWAEPVVLHLQNGDRITGTVVAEETNAVHISTSFGAKISIPKSQIVRREIVSSSSEPVKPPTVSTPSPVPPPQPAVPPPAAATAKPAPPKSPPASSGPTQPGKTNSVARGSFRKFISEWKGEMDLGLNLGFSTKDRQAYSGRFRAAHAHGLPNSHSLRNTLDYLFAYGQIDGVESDNRMDGSWKIEYDIGKRVSLYSAAGAGYDQIRHIDRQYDLGPGVGYKWITRTNYVLSTELGGNYQRQVFAGNILKQRYALRLGEESWWQISNKLRVDERLEFYPDFSDFSQFRVRAESNLSYALRNNLTLRLTVIDLYETEAPDDVSHNDLQIRSSIGIRF